jgi:dGTPase
MSDSSVRQQRVHREPVRAVDDRNPFQHDRDRIIYSAEFRRLGRVTQVVSTNERQLLHNRLTHSLEVAQIGRGLAMVLQQQPNAAEITDAAGGLSPEVVEAASLAHDLGHPPFGHVAEQELDELLVAQGIEDGFEGNAQSFRIATKLSTRHIWCEGMNLTRATLCALLKYPWTRGTAGKKNRKFGAYNSEADLLKWARESIAASEDIKSLEAKLMDWADDIAYAVHDLDDFFRSGLIPLDSLANDPVEQRQFLDARCHRIAESVGVSEDNVEETFRLLMGLVPLVTPYRGTKGERALMQSFTSRMVSRYIHSTSLVEGAIGEHAITIGRQHETEVAILKGLTWHYVIESQPLSTQRFGQKSLIRSLFGVYAECARSGNDWEIFPPFFRELLEDAETERERIRVAVDLIASMNESQAIEINGRLTGQSLGFALDRPYS